MWASRLAFALLMLGGASALGEVATPSAAPHFLVNDEQGAATLPLRSTHTEFSVAGVMTRLQVHRAYKNRGSRPIEAVYVFPKSTASALHGMRLRVGD